MRFFTTMISGVLGRLLPLLALLSSVYGQSTLGSIVGVVEDPSGAALAASKVTARIKGTSAQRSTVTDPGGNYVLTNIEPGMYEVAFEAPGFQRMVSEVELLSRQTARLDSKLNVAAQSESVRVEGLGSGPCFRTATVRGRAETKQAAGSMKVSSRNRVSLI